MKNISQLFFSIAALIAASAALVFAFQSGTARAAGSHYEFQVVYDANDTAEVMYVMDKESGKIWYADPTAGFRWGTINPQFSPSNGSAPAATPGAKKAPPPPPPHH